MRLITVNGLARANGLSSATINMNIKYLLDGIPELRERYKRNL